MSLSTYGKQIRELRKTINLSQAKLAKSAGISQAIISAWELDKSQPTEEQFKLILNIIEDTKNKVNEGKIRLNEKTIIRDKKKKTQKIPAITDAASYKELTKNLVSVPVNESNRAYLNTLQQLGMHICASEAAALNNKPKAIALFAGCGGLSLGFKAAGYHVVGHVEINEHARKVYEANFPDSQCLGTDVTQITNEEVLHWKKTYGHINVLFGGPPCQGFSLAGKRDPDDARNELFNDYLRIAETLEPDLLVFENVRLMTSMKDPNGTLFIDRFVENLKKMGFIVSYAELNAQNFGVPESRERVILIAVNSKISSDKIQFPKATHDNSDQLTLFTTTNRLLTFKDAVADLELLESGEASLKDPLHFAIEHPEHVIKWLKATPEGCSAHDNEDPSLRPPSGYNTTYKRIQWNEPCSTISTNFNMISGCRNVHPTNTRSFTIREATRVQSFPDNFIFFGPWAEIRRMIGNAVPPLFAKVIAQHVSDHILNKFIQV
jgi:DNA (cytosine-5)-methyltransferase 1